MIDLYTSLCLMKHVSRLVYSRCEGVFFVFYLILKGRQAYGLSVLYDGIKGRLRYRGAVSFYFSGETIQGHTFFFYGNFYKGKEGRNR